MTGDPKKRGLGRGLDALLGPEEAANDARTTQVLPVAALKPGALQPRQSFDEVGLEALAASIAEHGVLQPLLVRPAGDGVYEIVAGERRWRAAQKAHLHEVPVLIREIADAQALEIGLIENLQRADLDPIEEARGYTRLIDQFGHTAATLAKVLGRSRPHVANMLRLLTLPEGVQGLLAKGAISTSHARALLAAPDPAGLAEQVVKGGLSVRETERMAARAMRARVPVPPLPARAREATGVEALEELLGHRTGMAARVRITPSTGAGLMVLRFSELAQLEALLDRLAD
ncbi:MAG TPA: chromosome partitioning protein ParB [Rhodospirillaceae bacterium]|jgi:ParB family chromosome partitioning protein|nr:ParB/RepB/Spo0J family partition protein [Alphaproteobacteria bacterium]HBH26983.1 chromosome partitioning protein ParB [Rhodospirillaceae bacterium]